MNVAAVVVTYNRVELLKKAITAICAQTYPVNEIIIWNNASTDGTEEFLVSHQWPSKVKATIHTSSTNIGGAGGFKQGLLKAHEHGHDWIWLMDDDTIPRPTCLEELLNGAERCEDLGQPKVLASKVLWKNGTIHPMNLVGTKFGYDRQRFYDTTERGCISIRAASFVSCAVHRSAIDDHGLPLADYFIWSDDIEYTGRILRDEYGLCVPTSIADHLTANTYGTLDAQPQRFFYHVRNHAWLLRWSRAYSRSEKAKIAPLYAFNLLRYALKQHFQPAALSAIAKGLLQGLLRKPRT